MTKKEMEGAIANHADWIEHLAARMDELAAAGTKAESQIAETSKSLKEHGEATDRRIKELGEATDKRIWDLVSGIGELITKMPDIERKSDG
jgi:chromosome segregation ATPase